MISPPGSERIPAGDHPSAKAATIFSRSVIDSTPDKDPCINPLSCSEIPCENGGSSEPTDALSDPALNLAPLLH
jgi:hypothetical protein